MRISSILLALIIAAFLALSGCASSSPEQGGGIQAQPPAPPPAQVQLSPEASSSQPQSNGQEAQQPAQRLISLGELARHNKADDCWLAIGGKVVDVSAYDTHPAGKKAFLPYCGTDATAAYSTKGKKGEPHSALADSQLDSFLVGYLEK